MGFKGMSIWDWAQGYGKDSKFWSKSFRKRVFLKGQPVGEEFYIKCKQPLDYLPRSPSVITQAWTDAVESGHYYGGIVRHKKDVTNDGFNFYSPDGEKQVFVKFDDLVTIVRLEDNRVRK